MSSTDVTLVNAIEVPEESVDQFIIDWNPDKGFIIRQPGFIDGTIYRSLLPGARFRFVNIARWESEDAWKNALEAAEKLRASRGIDRLMKSADLGVVFNPALYREEIRY